MLDFLIQDYSIIIIFMAGMAGAFIADILKDNCLELPKIIGGKIYLGWVGGAIIGGVAGLLIDGSLVTAFMGGYIGKDFITNLIGIKTTTLTKGESEPAFN